MDCFVFSVTGAIYLEFWRLFSKLSFCHKSVFYVAEVEGQPRWGENAFPLHIPRRMFSFSSTMRDCLKYLKRDLVVSWWNSCVPGAKKWMKQLNFCPAAHRHLCLLNIYPHSPEVLPPILGTFPADKTLPSTTSPPICGDSTRSPADCHKRVRWAHLLSHSYCRNIWKCWDSDSDHYTITKYATIFGSPYLVQPSPILLLSPMLCHFHLFLLVTVGRTAWGGPPP